MAAEGQDAGEWSVAQASMTAPAAVQPVVSVWPAWP